MISLTTMSGAAGEHLVCADLLLRGISAMLAGAQFPYDIVADTGMQRLRVQVRSTRAPVRKPGRPLSRECYHFNIGVGAINSDLMAFVALDTRQIAYLPSASCPYVIQIDAENAGYIYPFKKGGRLGYRKFEFFTLEKALAETSEGIAA